ncbi:hypothetical protein B0J17DRAFT_710331 [Rhizoctonia solani]|nr:hypothetical protein B0J17DRAFT_710331 [Rhizoctonia solani]
MSHRVAASVDPPPVVNEGFTEGDLTIRSADGINFKVHSLFLSVASPLFSDLFKAGNNNEIFRFPENAEVLAVMLKFIYPKPTPVITSMHLLNDAVRIAKMYQLDNMKTRLREQLVLVDSPVSVYSNPLGALCIAATHGFTPEAELAANLASKQCDFEEGEDLKTLVDATQGPATAELVKLTGIPLVKTRVLVDILFHFERSPMKLCDNIDALRLDTTRGKVHLSGRRVGLFGFLTRSKIDRYVNGNPISVWSIEPVPALMPLVTLQMQPRSKTG